MFGTLVIALPAEHSGGDVEATFRGKTKVLETAPTSSFDFSYLAWFVLLTSLPGPLYMLICTRYSDVEHAVTKVTAGYRLVLTYNLIYTGLHTQPSAAANEEATQPFQDLLMTWAENVKKPGSHVQNKVAFMLDHKYTDANLRLNHLKGRDAVLANALMRALPGSECIFFLANVELVVDGGCEESDGYGYSSSYDTNFHAIEEEISRSLVLRLVVTPMDPKLPRACRSRRTTLSRRIVLLGIQMMRNMRAILGTRGLRPLTITGTHVSSSFPKADLLICSSRLRKQAKLMSTAGSTQCYKNMNSRRLQPPATTSNDCALLSLLPWQTKGKRCKTGGFIAPPSGRASPMTPWAKL
jgi:hypothetical protein